jgi:GAF domain-containing protein
MTAPQADSGDIAASIAELHSLLLSTSSLEELLQEMTVLAARSVAGSLSCGLTLQTNGRPRTVATSDTRAAQVDETQYDLDRGPCLRAMRTGQLVVIQDTSGEQRWGGFAARATAHGIRSSLSLPLLAAGITGALNLYSPVPRTFGPAQGRRGEIFAAGAAGALALAARQASDAELTGQLRTALAARAVIDQAIRILMAQERCTAAAAFAILRTASQNRNVKLRDLAAEIVTSVSGEPPQPPPFRQ